MVSELLIAQGWRALPMQSDRFALKWTYNECYSDYEAVRNRNRRDKNGRIFYNHIKNNNLVKKD